MAQTQLKWTEQKFDPRSFLTDEGRRTAPYYSTELGSLYDSDCMKMLPMIRSGVVDTVFADPPFNIGKQYGKSTDDAQPASHYISWCKEWLAECVRILKPGGSLFLYNLPKWNIPLGVFLQEQGLDFRHWIAIEMSACLPIAGRLHPSHYSLLYYSKGKPNVFHRIRTPILTCRHCGKEVKDYGGHRDAMNPSGVTLKDVWSDIPPVRHAKFKSQNRSANALSTKLLDRVILMSTKPCDLVVDPFGGSGTTFAVCETKNRHWLGSEIDYADDIVERLEGGEIHAHKNGDFVES
jgi:site-specific DNA-methyltransferase (adenine-specific)